MSSKADKFKELLSSFVHTRNDEEVTTNSPNVKDGISRQPRDKKAFYHRLHSFTQLTWFAKPVWLSPPVCARYGWQNVDMDMLQCVTCKAFLSGRMPSSFQPTIYTDCCKKLKESLKTAHHPFCPWSSNPSPEMYLTIPVPDTKEITEVLLQLISLGESLPRVTEESLCQLGIETKALLRLQETLCLADTCNLQVFTSVCVLALCGWVSKSKSPASALIRCSFCNREVGLWNYAQLNYNSDEEESEEESLAPSRKSAFKEISNVENETETNGKTPFVNVDEYEETSPTSHEKSSVALKSSGGKDDLCDSVGSSSSCLESKSDIFCQSHTDAVEYCVEDLVNRVASSTRTAENDSETEIGEKSRKTMQNVTSEDAKDNKDLLQKSEMKAEASGVTDILQEEKISGQEVKEEQSMIKEDETTCKRGSRIAEIAASLKSKVEKTTEEMPVKEEVQNLDIAIQSDQEDTLRQKDKEIQRSAECGKSVTESEAKGALPDLDESCEMPRSDSFRHNAEIPDDSVIEVLDSSSEDEDVEHAQGDNEGFGAVEIEVGGEGMVNHQLGDAEHYFQNGYVSEEIDELEVDDTSSEDLVIQGEDVEEDYCESEGEELFEEEEESYEQVEQEEGPFAEDESDSDVTGDDVEMSDLSHEVAGAEAIEYAGGIENKSSDEEEMSSTPTPDVGFTHLYGKAEGMQGMASAVADGNEEDEEYESDKVEGEFEEDDVASDSSEVMILSSDSDEHTQSHEQNIQIVVKNNEDSEDTEKNSFDLASESFCSSMADIPVKQWQEERYSFDLDEGHELRLQLSPEDIGNEKNNTGSVQHLGEFSHEGRGSNTGETADQTPVIVHNTKVIEIEEIGHNNGESVIRKSEVQSSGNNTLQTMSSEEPVTADLKYQQGLINNTLLEKTNDQSVTGSNSDSGDEGIVSNNDIIIKGDDVIIKDNIKLSSYETKKIELSQSAGFDQGSGDKSMEKMNEVQDETGDCGISDMPSAGKTEGSENIESTTSAETTTDVSDLNTPTRKRKKKNAKVNFDPLQEHRCWCVWVNSFPCTEEMDKPAGSMHTVVGSEHEPAWRVMRDNLLPEVSPVKEDAVHMIKTSPPVEGLRRIRRLLSDWASPQVKVKLTS